MAYQHIVHPIEPLYHEESEMLILGSFPSVKSREQMFFYGHQQNRFWKVVAGVFHQKVPQTILEKKALLMEHHIALWDVIYSCDIEGSADNSIKNVTPTDLKTIIENSKITRVFCNGKASGECYAKYQEKETNIPAVVLPSTSPANAAWNLERLTDAWQIIAKKPDC